MDGLFTAQVLWVLAGVAFLVAELAWPGFVLLFFALGAFAAALGASALGLAAGGQIMLFLAASAAGLALLRRMFLRVFRGGRLAPEAEPKSPGDEAIGKTAEAASALGPGQPGQIRYRGSFWRAQAAQAVAPGQRVVITGLAPDDPGAYLVRPAGADAPQG